MEIARKKISGIDSVEDLQIHLQTALVLEHATIPPYFTAWLSSDETANPAAAQIIRSVMLEEMLHLTLAANLLNAVGGQPNLTDPEFIPHYPHRLPHSGRHFLVSIERLSPQALDTFLKIERPESEGAPPEGDQYQTIGQFYGAIAEGFQRVTAQIGAERVFTGLAERQMTLQEYYGSGKLVSVRDLRSALEAIAEIKEQGEGASESVFDEDEVIIGDGPGFEPAHYFRFKELQLGRRYKPGDTLRSGPTGVPVPVHYEAVLPIARNPKISDYAPDSPIRKALEGFCDAYQALLVDLEAAFLGEQNRFVQGMARMFDLKNRALALMRTPVHVGKPETVGLAFRRH